MLDLYDNQPYFRKLNRLRIEETTLASVHKLGAAHPNLPNLHNLKKSTILADNDHYNGPYTKNLFQQSTEHMQTILLIEDNEMNRDMLSRRLQRKGYEVLMANDGEAGIKMAHSTQPNIIIMDMGLPLLDGWEATRRLKADTHTKHIPVIGLSAHAMTGDRDKGLEAGCDEYDTKPVNLDRLLSKIQHLLHHANTSQPT